MTRDDARRMCLAAAALVGRRPAVHAQPAPERRLRLPLFVASEADRPIALVRSARGRDASSGTTKVGITPIGSRRSARRLAVSPTAAPTTCPPRTASRTATSGSSTPDDTRTSAASSSGTFPRHCRSRPTAFYAYVVNFNLHGEMVPSTVSVVSTDEMVEVARIQTCTMPHGSRLNADGTQALLGVHDG